MRLGKSGKSGKSGENGNLADWELQKVDDTTLTMCFLFTQYDQYAAKFNAFGSKLGNFCAAEACSAKKNDSGKAIHTIDKKAYLL